MGSPACPGELVEYTPDPIRGPGYRVTPDGLSVGAPGFPEGWVITCSKNPRDCDTCPRRESMRKESATLENRLNAEFFVIRQEESNLRDLHCSGFVVCDMDDQDREALRRSLCPDGGDS